MTGSVLVENSVGYIIVVKVFGFQMKAHKKMLVVVRPVLLRDVKKRRETCYREGIEDLRIHSLMKGTYYL